MNTIALVLLGVVIGALLDGFTGALFGAMIGAFWGRLQELARRLDTSERQIRSLMLRDDERARTTHAAQAASRPHAPQSGAPAGPASPPPAAFETGTARETTAPQTGRPAPPVFDVSPTPATDAGITRPLGAPSPRAAVPNIAASPPSRPPAAPAGALQPLVDFFTTGNLLVKVGVIILFFGVAFLVRYAAERGLVPIEYRLMGVVVGALVMLGLGWHLRARRPDYAMPVQGGAIGLLYLTIFAAFRIYELLPGSLTFALLLAVVALSGMLAVLQNAVALATLGASGGFLAPILASTGSGSHVALFAYYLVLNAGVLGIAWFRSWRILNWIGFVFTFGIGLIWGAQYYQPALLGTTEPFLIAFFLLYVAVAVLHAHRRPPELRGYIDGSLVFGLPAVAFAMQSVLVSEVPLGRAYSAVAVSALYLVLARWLWRRDAPIRPLAEAFLAIGVVFLTLAVPFAFDGPATAAAWALEGAGLVWIGVRQQRLAARLFGTALQIGAGAMFAVYTVTRPPDAMAVLNSQFLGAIAVAIGAVLSARQFDVARAVRREWEAPLEWVLLAWGVAWWGAAMQIEIETFASFRLYPSMLLLGLAASAALAGGMARWWAWRALRLATLIVLPLLWFVAVVSLIDLSGPWRDLGWLAWPAAVAAGFALLRWFDREWPASAARAWHAGTAWLVAFLLAWTAYAAGDLLLPESSAWGHALWGAIPALLVLVLLRAGDRPAWPVGTWRSVYHGVVPLGLLGFALVWAFVACMLEGSPAPLPYVPLVNPLEAAQAFVVLVFLRWQWTPAARQAMGPIAAAAVPGVGLVAFLAANAMVGRIVHFSFGVPYSMDALSRSAVFQAGISILWALTALSVMLLASRRASRPVWFAGAGLLALLVLKLFTVDLGNVGGVARIVSFLVTGVLLLIVGYYSPLPPSNASEASDAQEKLST